MVDSKENYKIDLGVKGSNGHTLLYHPRKFKPLFAKNLSVFVNSCSQLWCVTTNWKLIPFAFKVHKPFESIKCHLKSILKPFVHTVDNKYLVKHLGPHWKLRIPIPALLTYDLHGLHVNNYYKV